MLILSNIDLNGIPIIRYLSDLEIEHPVYVDFYNEFFQANYAIPKDNKMHSFLISRFGSFVCWRSNQFRKVFQVFGRWSIN